MHITWLTRSSEWCIRFMTVFPAPRNIFLLFSALHGLLWCIRTFISEAIRTKIFFCLTFLTGVFDIVYRNYLLYKFLNTFLFILIDIFMLYRCMKSLRWYNILTRQRVSTKYKISVYLCKQTYQSEELRKTITCLTWLLHFIIIDHLSRCMRIKAANNVIVSTKLCTELLSLCFNTDNTCTSSFVVFKYK